MQQSPQFIGYTYMPAGITLQSIGYAQLPANQSQLDGQLC